MTRRSALVAGIAVLGAAWTQSAQAALIAPAGFQERTISTALTNPTGFAEAPDGRIFVIEQRGTVKVVRTDGSLSPTVVYNLSNHVNSYNSRGLLGIAMDKNFASNGYIYLYYTYDHNTADYTGQKTSRLVRIQVTKTNTLVNPSQPETVLLGSYAPPAGTKLASCPPASNVVDCIPAETSSHNGGAVRVDTDGTIWLASGDANFGGPASNRYRPYDETSFAGKIIHVDTNGRGLPGHPFCPTDTTLTHVCTKLHSKGFRNPFRMTLRSGGLGPIVGDVGENAYEELDLIRPGRNYGWPCYEGNSHEPDFQSDQQCRDLYSKEGTSAGGTPPAWTYTHWVNGTYTGACIIAGPLYTATLFPALYRNKIYVGDYTQGWVRELTVDSSDRVTNVENFGTGWNGVDLQQLSTGELAYIHWPTHALYALGYTTQNQRPVAVANSDVTSGDLPLTVNFSATGSSDPDGDPLSYEWDFGDGSAKASGATTTHTYTQHGPFTATLTVTDNRGGVGVASMVLHPGDHPPTVEISSPANGSSYRDGETITLHGTGSDQEDGAVTGSALTWEIVLHHLTHTHPFVNPTGEDASFATLVDHDIDSWYEIRLTATDAEGMSTTTAVRINPEPVELTFTSQPSGALMSYAGIQRVAPFTLTAAVGFRAPIGAADSVVSNGITYLWSNWSDGGTQGHSITVPAANATYTATYSRDTDPPETTITKKPLSTTANKQVSLEFVADEPVMTYTCRLDNGAWTNCSSPYWTPVMQPGQHQYWVYAIDVAGNVDPTPAYATWKQI